MTFVILPQAFRVVIPPITNNCINVMKDTALASIVLTNLRDVLWHADRIRDSLDNPLQMYTVVAVVFIVLCLGLDRLARSTRDLLNILDTIAKAGAGFKSLKDAWADTTTAHGRLMLTVLAGLAEFERELIRARTGEGRARAKAAGRKMGRPHKLTPHQQQEARERRGRGETLVSIARSYNVHHATIGRL